VISEVNRVIKRAEDDEELKKLAEMSTDVEHNPKTPLGLDAKKASKEAEEAPGASLSLSEVKQLLDSEQGRAAETEAEPPDFEMTPVEEPPGPSSEEEAP
jgi:hypothetical protein